MQAERGGEKQVRGTTVKNTGNGEGVMGCKNTRINQVRCRGKTNCGGTQGNRKDTEQWEQSKDTIAT